MASSYLYLFQGVPLDSSYEHCLNFNSGSAGLNYLTANYSYTYYPRSDTGSGLPLSYIRPESGHVEVEGVLGAGQAASNYMVFCNPSIENKLWFAFVKQTYYINERTIGIDFELDLVHSFMENLVTNRCFIERQHSTTDLIDDNVEPEPFNPELKVAANFYIPVNTDVKIWFYKDPDGSGTSYTPIAYDVNSKNIIASIPSLTGVTNVLNKYKDFYNSGYTNYIVAIGSGPIYAGVQNTDYQVPINTVSINGYTPRNKKVLSRLYQKFIVSGSNGQSFTYDTTDITGSIARFQLTTSDIGAQPEAKLRLMNYNNVGTDLTRKLKSLSYSDFPVFPFQSSFWNEYFSKKGLQTAIGGITNIGGAVATGAALGGAPGAVVGGLGALAGLGTQIYEVSRAEDKINGSQSSLLNYINNEIGFSVTTLAPLRQQLELIDWFFDRYGYAQNKCTSPNINTRLYFTYVKTRDSGVSGSMPDTARRKFDEIFNKGATFWTTRGKIRDWSHVSGNRPY